MRVTVRVFAFVALLASTSIVRAQIASEVRWTRGVNASIGGESLPLGQTNAPKLRPGSDALGGIQTNAMQWIEGVSVNSATVNCIGGYQEPGINTWTGYYGDTNATFPKVGDVYYVHVVFGQTGNPCAGGSQVVAELVPPPNTYLNITASTPVKCYANGSLDTADCPQTATQGTYGYRFTPLNNQSKPWPTPVGHSWEILVPVVSTATLSGSNVQWALQAIDGVFNQWVYPAAAVFVANNPPTISYPPDSRFPSLTTATSSITNTSARGNAISNHHFAGGNVYFDIGATTSYGTTSSPAPVSTSYDAQSFYVDWTGLAPGTTYHWRMRFVSTSGTTTALGADQAFTTTGSVRVRGDFNADGKPDIVLRNYASGQNALWLMNGTALMSIVDLPALTNTSWRIEGTADFNNDGQNDIVLRNYTTGQNALWLMNGTALTSIVDLPALANTSYHIEGTADLNGDGSPDIILRNYSSGQNAVWLMNGTTFTGIADLPALPNPAYHIESAADFNGDGKPDIVLRNYTTGQNAVWLMNGMTLTSVVDLPALPNTSYRFDAIGDFNNDNKADIVLRNYATGQNAVWLMNGTTLSSIVDLPALPNTSYEINGPR